MVLKICCYKWSNEQLYCLNSAIGLKACRRSNWALIYPPVNQINWNRNRNGLDILSTVYEVCPMMWVTLPTIGQLNTKIPQQTLTLKTIILNRFLKSLPSAIYLPNPSFSIILWPWPSRQFEDRINLNITLFSKLRAHWGDSFKMFPSSTAEHHELLHRICMKYLCRILWKPLDRLK